jgi:DNA-binding XRE family transcriptional regulator
MGYNFLQSADNLSRYVESELALLTENEMANKLGITPRTLANWRKKRKVPYIKVAGLIRYSWPRVRQALDAFEVKEASRTEQQPTSPPEIIEGEWVR